MADIVSAINAPLHFAALVPSPEEQTMPAVAHIKIVRNAPTNEWIVRAYDAMGDRIPEADYYTDDKTDAEQTADAMVAWQPLPTIEEIEQRLAASAAAMQ